MRKGKSILLQIHPIDFNKLKQPDDQMDSKQLDVLRKNKIIEKKKMFDQLTAQLDFMQWLLTKGKFNLSELQKLKFNSD